MRGGLRCCSLVSREGRRARCASDFEGGREVMGRRFWGVGCNSSCERRIFYM